MNSRPARLLAVLLPVTLAARTVGDEGRPPPVPAPPPHSVDVWLDHQEGVRVDPVFSRAAEAEVLRQAVAAPTSQAQAVLPTFETVGSVAVFEGDDRITV